MLGRHHSTAKGTPLHKEWIQNLETTLTTCHLKILKKMKKQFMVAGKTFKDEILIGTSLLHTEDLEGVAFTYFVSSTLTDRASSTKILQVLVNSIGLFFDDYLTNKIDNKLTSTLWKEFTLEGTPLFYKTSRENIYITTMADKLLE